LTSVFAYNWSRLVFCIGELPYKLYGGFPFPVFQLNFGEMERGYMPSKFWARYMLTLVRAEVDLLSSFFKINIVAG